MIMAFRALTFPPPPPPPKGNRSCKKQNRLTQVGSKSSMKILRLNNVTSPSWTQKNWGKFQNKVAKLSVQDVT